MCALDKIFAETSHTATRPFYVTHSFHSVVNSAQCAFSCHFTPAPSGGQKSLAMAHRKMPSIPIYLLCT